MPIAAAHQRNPVDVVASVLRPYHISDENRVACHIVEALAAELHQRFGGSSVTADWLNAAAELRSERY